MGYTKLKEFNHEDHRLKEEVKKEKRGTAYDATYNAAFQFYSLYGIFFMVLNGRLHW